MIRLIVAAFLLVVLSATRAQQATPAVKSTVQRCGSYTLNVRENGFEEPADTVSIMRGAQVLATVSDSLVSVGWCRDVTGDGVPEVLLTGFSGGAHCCFTQHVYALTSPPRELLNVFTADSDTVTPRQLDGRGPLELYGDDWRFAYAYGLSFAESAPLPVVYSYLPVAGGAPRYVDNSRAFAGFLVNATRTENSDEFGGGVLASYATRLAVAPAEAASYLAALPARYRAWLTNYGPDIRAALSDFGLQDWPLRAGESPSTTQVGLGGAFSAPGTREYLALVGRGSAGTLRLYRAQGAAVVAGPALQTVPLRQDQYGSVTALFTPAFAVRRASGRDDVIVRDERSGSVRYAAQRVTTAALTPLTDDPLAVAATLLGDLSNVARQVASSYARPTPPRTPAQLAAVKARIDAAIRRAQPWADRSAAPLDLAHLGAFAVGGMDLPVDTADRAQVTATADVGFANDQTTSEYVDSRRFTVTIDLVRREGGWVVQGWTLTPLTGELYPE